MIRPFGYRVLSLLIGCPLPLPLPSLTDCINRTKRHWKVEPSFMVANHRQEQSRMEIKVAAQSDGRFFHTVPLCFLLLHLSNRQTDRPNISKLYKQRNHIDPHVSIWIESKWNRVKQSDRIVLIATNKTHIPAHTHIHTEQQCKRQCISQFQTYHMAHNF